MRQMYSPEFEAFWQAYPRRISKKEAFKAFQRAIYDGVNIDDILKAVETYKKWLKGDGWRPEPKHPTTWLNQGCWDDEYDIAEDNQAELTFKIPFSFLALLRKSGIEDNKIKRWFDDAEFLNGGATIQFQTQFMRDYVNQHFASNLVRGFGIVPELVITKKAG